MAAYCNIHLRVIGAHELPKTDLFSQIDPYVVVSVGGEKLGRTVTRDNNPNPIWQEDFFFEVEESEEGLHGTIVLDLYDEEVTTDEHVGFVRLDLQALVPEQLLEPQELPLNFKADKRGQKLARAAPRARLALQVVAIGKAFSSYASELAEAEGVIVDEPSRTVLLPVPDTDEVLWAGLRFGTRSTQLLLLATADPKASPNPAVWYDMSYAGAPSLRLERLQYRKPVKLLGLRVWSELRATNVPLDAKLGKVRILEREHRLVDTLDPADTLVGHNYMIGMPWLAAVKELAKRTTTAHVDSAAQVIWIKMDSNQPQPAQLLMLDYGEQPRSGDAAEAATAAEASPRGGGGGRKAAAPAPGKFPALRVCSTSSELNKGYELAFFGGGGRGSAGPMVTVSEAFRRPKPVLGGLYDIVHTVELRDAFVGDVLEVGLGVYELMKPSRTWRLGKLLDGAARGELGEIHEGGYGSHGGGADGADGEGASGGGGGARAVILGLFSWVPCLAPSRADAYVDEGPAAGASRHRGAAAVEEEWEDGRGASRRRDGRSGGGVSRARSGTGGGVGSGSASPSPRPGPKTPRAASGVLQGTGGSTAAAGARGGGGVSRGYVGATASVGSSSGRSASLATYNSTKSKYDNKYGRGNTAGSRRLASLPSNKSLGGRRSRSEEAEEED
ncbi:hypothetical protein PLESTB_000784100 [Pleodorina starrii]|uniref:C2 domain-containing protein n=1 Tax=Pleodorina starrii TaxID=330485 RepID=A0A9W6F2E8_9CHLO|nr:hypothetical protein PLESTM_000500800 [Pleodorina starrii]GLC53759.1 hypothetical protein PLESTB_000784100 [Pleodorina starrii]GLC72939.1 hypothetical protein PLESTF_001311700 [Pleodorina starrii]